MNLNLLPDLALFVQIVDQGSFSAVARQSGLTPSAVSRSVSRLEREMGSKLLHRTTRKLRLSDAGETVYQHAQQMLEAARQAIDSASSRQTVAQGKLTLSVPKAVGRFVIHPLMMAFFHRYPQVDVCLRLEDRPLDFIDDGIDLALRITDTPSPGLHGKPLMPIRHVICATEPYLQQHGTPYTPQDLRAHCCISLGETPADARWKFRREGKSETVQTYGGTPPTIPPSASTRLSSIWALAACRCLPLARRWRRAISCRYCPSGNSSAATPATCGYCGREISICPPGCG